MLVSEATLEFPDGEIDAVNRVLAGAARRGAIPRDAVLNWPITNGFPARSKAEPKPVSKPKPKESPPQKKGPAPEGNVEPDTRSGRVIPSTNRFRQPDRDPSGNDDRPKSAGSSKDRDRAGPGLLKKAVSKVTGKDPETGYRKPRPANVKVHGGHGPATSLPRLDRVFGSGTGDEFSDERTDPEYVSPFAHISGLSGDGDEADDKDPKLAAIRKGLTKAKPHAPKPPNTGFPEAGAWEKFGRDRTGTDVGGGNSGKKRQQGRLSRLFKGRRDNGI